jgi:hypothetical protein
VGCFPISSKLIRAGGHGRLRFTGTTATFLRKTATRLTRRENSLSLVRQSVCGVDYYKGEHLFTLDGEIIGKAHPRKRNQAPIEANSFFRSPVPKQAHLPQVVFLHWSHMVLKTLELALEHSSLCGKRRNA